MSQHPLEFNFFADDALIYKSYSKSEEMTTDFNCGIQLVLAWADHYQISLSIQKCHYVCFTRLHEITPQPQPIGNETLAPEQDFKYLGVHFDKRLTFNNHFNYTRRKCMASLLTIRRLSTPSNGLRPILLRRIFQGTIPPILHYGYEAWIAESRRDKWIQMSHQIYRLASIWILGLHKTVSSTAAIGISGLTPPHIHLIKHLLRLPHRLGPHATIGAHSHNPTHYSNRDAYHLTKDRMIQELHHPADRRPPPPHEDTRPSSQACTLPELR